MAVFDLRKKHQEMLTGERVQRPRRNAMRWLFGPVLFLMCGFPASFPAGIYAETRRALLVGIDKYEPKQATAAAAAGKTVVEKAEPSSVNTPPARGTWFDLDGAVNDVEAMRAVLIARCGFQPGNVRVLRNEEATRERILAEVRRQLIDPVVPGDVAVFFYAGHGSQVNNSQSSELDKKDETIVPADASQGVWDIRDKELRRLFNDVLDKGARLTVFFDSCHSDSIARGLTRERGGAHAGSGAALRLCILPRQQREKHPAVSRPEPGQYGKPFTL